MSALITHYSIALHNALLIVTGLCWLEAPTLLTSKGLSPIDPRKRILAPRIISIWTVLPTTDVAVRGVCALISTLAFAGAAMDAGEEERRKITLAVTILVHSFHQVGFTGQRPDVLLSTVVLVLLIASLFFIGGEVS